MPPIDIDVTELLRHPATLLSGLAFALVLLLWLAGRVRAVARSERPEDTLATVAMVVGLGWSSEAVWEITGRADFPLGVRLLLFFVLEVFLSVSMLRAKRHMQAFGWPGRPGQTAWGVAAAMGIVALAMSTSLPEALLRLAIPLGLAKLWWDGLVGGKLRPEAQASSWRWTPRRVLLWLGAIEPGQQDVATVHREALIGRMTALYFSLDKGTDRKRQKRAEKLAQLSLDADQEIIGQVRERVARAGWFLQPEREVPAETASAVVLVQMPASHLSEFPITVQAPPVPAQPTATSQTDVPAAQRPREDSRTKQQIEEVVHAMRATFPGHSQRQIAAAAGTSPSNVSRILGADRNARSNASANGDRESVAA